MLIHEILTILVGIVSPTLARCMKKLYRSRLDPKCNSDSFVDHRLTCVNAIDGVEGTLWAPVYGSGRGSWIELNFIHPAKINRIDILQHYWPSGAATGAEMITDVAKYDINFGPTANWSRVRLPQTTKTKKVRLNFVKIKGAAIGGIKEIVFYGCMSKIIKKVEKKTENVFQDRSTMFIIAGGGVLVLILTILGVCLCFMFFKKKKERHVEFLEDLEGGDAEEN